MHLGRICGQDTEASKSYRGDIELATSSIVFLRPFKLLVAFETTIRDSVQEVEARIQKKLAETAETQDKAEQKKDTKRSRSGYDDKHLLIDLKLLIEFLDVNLNETFKLRKEIKDQTATTIEYRDLWHLFQIGEDVIHQSKKQTFFRVVNFTVSNSLPMEFTAAHGNESFTLTAFSRVAVSP